MEYSGYRYKHTRMRDNYTKFNKDFVNFTEVKKKSTRNEQIGDLLQVYSG